MTPENYAKAITKGFWMAPKRKREIEREIIEHLEDMSEETGRDDLSIQEIEQSFGSTKQLRGIYNQGGLPMWAKMMKWGLYCFGFLFGLFMVFDLSILFFYSIDPTMIQAYKTNKAFYDQFDPARQSILPEIKIEWLDPANATETKTWETFQNAIAALDEIYNAEGRAHQEFFDRPEIAEKVKSAKPQAMPGMMNAQGGYGGMGMGMGMGLDVFSVLSKEEKQKFDELTFKISQDAYDQLSEAWLSIKPSDRLRFPRPTVSEEDIDLFRSVKGLTMQEMYKKAMDPKSNLQIHSKNQWLQYANTITQRFPDFDEREVVQNAKEIFVQTPFHLRMQDIIGKLRDRHKRSPIEIAAKHARASFLWCQQYMDATQPSVTELVSLLIVTASSQSAYSMLTDHIQSLDDIEAMREPIREFVKIPLKPFIDTWPLPSLDALQSWSMTDTFCTYLGQFSFFKIQCDAMQNFHETDSDGWLHYELMKKGVMLVLFKIAIPNLENVKKRIETAVAKQDMAKVILALQKKSPEEAQAFIENFKRDDLRFATHEQYATLHAPGPNGVFDEGVYDPSNGIDSKGDLLWEMRLRD